MFPEEATENLFSITALPWMNYSSLELHYSNEEIMLSPIVTSVDKTLNISLK